MGGGADWLTSRAVGQYDTAGRRFNRGDTDMRVFPNSVYIRVGVCAVGVLVAALAVLADVGGGPKLLLKLTVSVVDSRGKPVQGVPLIVYTGTNEAQFCSCSNTNGKDVCQ